MKNRLMKLAGLLKEDFDLPDESPFETIFPENTHVYFEVLFPGYEDFDAELKIKEFRNGNYRKEAEKYYEKEYDAASISADLEGNEDLDIGEFLKIEEEDSGLCYVVDQSTRYETKAIFIGPNYQEAEEIVKLLKEKGETLTYKDIRPFLP